MNTWIIAAVIAAMAGVFVVIRTRRHLPDPATLKVGDVIGIHGDSKFTISGAIRCRDDSTEPPCEWALFQLDKVIFGEAYRTKYHLYIAGKEFHLRVEDGFSDSAPDSSTYNYKGAKYSLIRRGSAEHTSTNTTALRGTGRVNYCRYKARDGSVLSFERYNGGLWEVSIGHRLPANSITVYPS